MHLDSMVEGLTNSSNMITHCCKNTSNSLYITPPKGLFTMCFWDLKLCAYTVLSSQDSDKIRIWSDNCDLQNLNSHISKQKNSRKVPAAKFVSASELPDQKEWNKRAYRPVHHLCLEFVLASDKSDDISILKDSTRDLVMQLCDLLAGEKGTDISRECFIWSTTSSPVASITNHIRASPFNPSMRSKTFSHTEDHTINK